MVQHEGMMSAVVVVTIYAVSRGRRRRRGRDGLDVEERRRDELILVGQPHDGRGSGGRCHSVLLLLSLEVHRLVVVAEAPAAAVSEKDDK